MTKPCLGPDPNPRPPKFPMPPGACDCHAHVFAAPEVYPYVPERSYTPPPATLEAYQALHRVLGIERAVIVQPSVYGTDNRVTLEAIAGYGPNCRGVAVVDETVNDKEIARLNDGGVRGLRLNVGFGGGVGLYALEPLAERIAAVTVQRFRIGIHNVEGLTNPGIGQQGNRPLAIAIECLGVRIIL